MKKTTQFFLLTAFTCFTYAQEITLMDFGPSAGQTSGNWNNLTIQNVINTTTNLIDNTGATTGEVLTLTDVFDLYEKNNLGTQSPDPGLPFPNTAAQDSFFGESVVFDNGGGPSTEPTGGFTLSGLEIGKFYSFKIFASRTGVSDNRETLYTIIGNSLAQTATLDAANNTANVANILNIQPNVSGEITIQAETGPNNTNANGFYYLGAMEMTKTDVTLSNKNIGFNGVVNVYPNPSSEFVNINLNLNAAAKVQISLYDLTGKKVKTILNEQKQAGHFIQTFNSSKIATGIYVLEIDADGRKHSSKLILK